MIFCFIFAFVLVVFWLLWEIRHAPLLGSDARDNEHFPQGAFGECVNWESAAGALVAPNCERWAVCILDEMTNPPGIPLCRVCLAEGCTNTNT